MLPFAISAAARPSRIEDDKTEKYHLEWARYASVGINNPTAISFFLKCYRNRAFYLGQQWDRKRDIAFLEDDAGESRGREPIVDNYIRPFVNQMINEAQKMNLNFKVVSEGDKVINRREKELNRMKVGRIIADKHPSLAPYVKKSIPIGNNMEETEEIFRNVWVDQYPKTINNMVKYVIQKNRFDSFINPQVAEGLAINGLSVIFNPCVNGEMCPRVIDAEDFFFDTAAKMFDLSDSEFMGHVEYAMPTDLYERYDLSEDTKQRIEKFTKEFSQVATQFQPLPFSYQNLPGRVPVVYVEWRDSDRYTFGYVIDQFGYELFTRVYSNDYKPKNNERVYYEKDLVMPKSDHRKMYMKGKKKRTIDVEVLRYCKFTPAEVYVGKGNDIVYDYGVVPYQEAYALDPTYIEFSYRCTCWGYHDGWISSPLDDIIDPQREVNLYRSMALNKASKDTEGIAYDKFALMGTGENEADLQRKIERGETIGLNSKGMGVVNAVMEYGARLAQSAQVMTNMANEKIMVMQQRTGVLNISPKEKKKQVLGAEEEEQSLHGLYLNRIVSLFQSEYQCIANKGKRIYADSPRRLAIMVGDKGAEEIVITKDMVLEDFRCFVKRSDDEKQSKQMADATLTQLLQMQIITPNDYADNYGRTGMDEVGKVIRDSLIRKNEAQKLQAQAQQEQQQQQNMLMQAQAERAELQKEKDKGIELSEAAKDRMAKLDAIILRAKTKMAVDNNKHELNMDAMAHEQKK